MTADLTAVLADLRFRREAHADLVERDTTRTDFHREQLARLDAEIIAARRAIRLAQLPQVPLCQTVADDVARFWTSEDFAEKRRAKQMCVDCPLSDGRCARMAVAARAKAAIWNGIDAESARGQQLIRRLAAAS